MRNRRHLDAHETAAMVIGVTGLLVALLGAVHAATHTQNTDPPPHHQPVTTTDTSTSQKD